MSEQPTEKEQTYNLIRSLQKEVAELRKTLAAVPLYYSDEYSDYVCTYCLSDDGHEEDCVALKEQDDE